MASTVKPMVEGMGYPLRPHIPLLSWLARCTQSPDQKGLTKIRAEQLGKWAPWTKKDDRGGTAYRGCLFLNPDSSLLHFPPFWGGVIPPFEGWGGGACGSGLGIWWLRAACPHRLPESLKLWKRATITAHLYSGPSKRGLGGSRYNFRIIGTRAR
jgi:hypothetical protein